MSGLMALWLLGTVSAAQSDSMVDAGRVRERLLAENEVFRQVRYTGNIVLLTEPEALEGLLSTFALTLEHADESAGLAIVSAESGVVLEDLVEELAEHKSVKAVRLETSHTQRQVL